MLEFPVIDPVALYIGGFEIRWYGIAYAVGILFTLCHAQALCRLYNNTPITEKHIDDLFTYALFGIIIGGRLGYVCFYNGAYYLQNPLEIVQLWHGGMSFHGGFLGVLLASLFFANKEKISLLSLTDRIAPGACLGLFFGRLANFVNGELWGKTTDVPWAMVFPNAGNMPRHPSQLYEAFFEGLLLFIVLNYLAKKINLEGVISGIFLSCYGFFRFVIEFVRQPDDIVFLQEGIFNYISMGQLLSIPMLGGGVYLLYRAYRRKKELDDLVQQSYKRSMQD